MKKYTLLLFVFALCIEIGYSQSETIDTTVANRISKIVSLIRMDRIVELSTYIKYPLKREYPIPDIQNEEQFILYYPTLLDSTFKRKLKYYSSEDIFERYGNYGLVSSKNGLCGEVWLNDEFKIISFNCQTETETKLLEKLIKEEQSHMHPSIKSWKRNLVLCENEKFIIRIDETEDGLRYISWSIGKKTLEKPDLVLNNGKLEFRGTMGGETYTFINGDWTYVIDNIEICEDESGCGLFLRLLYKNEEKSTLKLNNSKNAL